MIYLPNAVTISRFFLIPVYLLVFFSDAESSHVWAFLVLLLAGATDLLDGYLARKLNLISQTGIMLDPLADKLMLLSVVISLVLSGIISGWTAAAFVIRDAAMIVGSALYRLRMKKAIPANNYGKLTALLFYVSFFFIFFEFPGGESFLWGVIAFSFITAAIYITAFKKLDVQYET